MPPPGVVRANIQRATAGRLSTPRELYDKAKDAMDRGQFETMLNDEEVALLARNFYAIDDPAFSPGARMAVLSAPGSGLAMGLLSSRQGLEATVFEAAAICHTQRARQMPAAFPGLGPSSTTVSTTAAPQGRLGQGNSQ